MLQSTASQSRFSARLLGGAMMILALMLASCCPPLSTIGNTGRSCTCTKAEKQNKEVARDGHTHVATQKPGSFKAK